MKNIFLIIGLLVGLNTLSFGQTSGYIYDGETKEPLSFAIITDASGNYAESDELGFFSIDGATGPLTISFIGYADQTVEAGSNISVLLQPEVYLSDDIVITGSRSATERTKEPIAITSIDQTALDDNKITSLDQVLNHVPGVNLVDLGNEQHMTSIRQPISTGAVFLFLEDGIPLRSAGVFNHNALLEANLPNLGRIEVVRGPSSALYGSEAIGGAINLISKKPTKDLTVGLSLQENSIGLGRRDIYVSNTIGKFAFRVNGGLSNIRDGFREHEDYEKYYGGLTATYNLTDHSYIDLAANYIDYDAETSGSIDSTRFFSRNFTSQQTFTFRKVQALRTRLGYKHFWKNNSSTKLNLVFRDNSIKQNPTFRIRNGAGRQNDNSHQSFAFVGQHEQKFKWLNSSILIGSNAELTPNSFEEFNTTVTTNAEGVNTDFAIADLREDYETDIIIVGTYLSGKVEPVKGLTVSGALRHDFFNYDFDQLLESSTIEDGSNSFQRISPKLGAAYNHEKLGLGGYANYALGFSPPTTRQLYIRDANIDLEPAIYNNYEIGVWKSFSVGGKNNLRAELNAYYLAGRDEFVSRDLPNSGGTTTVNAGETSHRGIEYGVQYSPIKDVLVRFSGTNAIHEFEDFVDGDDDFTGLRQQFAPTFSGNGQVTYKPSYIPGARVSLEWQRVGSYYADEANEVEYEGYNLLNAKVGYKYKKADVWLNFQNITQEEYATRAEFSRDEFSFNVGNPFNVLFGISYTFEKSK